MKVKCERCKKEFDKFPCWVKRTKKQYCSRKCLLEATATTKKTCNNCKKTFIPSSYSKKAKYCSPKCWYEYFSKSTLVNRECRNCGKMFLVHEGDLRKRKCIFCSPECKIENQGITPIKKCMNCGKDYRKKGNKGFCSFSCFRKYKGESSLEKMFREELEKRNIKFKQEVPIGRFSIDFIVGNRAIELDGNYWHEKEAVKERDRRKELLTRIMGYRFIRFKEDEIKKDVSKCVDIISKT